MLKKLSFIFCILNLFILISCSNITFGHSNSIDFTIGDSAAQGITETLRANNSVTDQTKLTIDCELLRGEKPIDKITKTATLADFKKTRFAYNSVTFGNSYYIRMKIYVNDGLIYEGLSDLIVLNEDNEAAAININIHEHFSSIKYEFNGGKFPIGTRYQKNYFINCDFTIPEPEKKYSIFDGWYSSADFSPESRVLELGKNCFLGDVTLYAKWISLNNAPKKTGTTTIDGKVYPIVEFGTWPQTIKATGVEIYTTQTYIYNGWTCYKGSDGEYYVKMKVTLKSTDASRTGGYEKYSDGSKITAGEECYFKMEPIRWRVLTNNYNNTGNYLLLAEKALSTNPLTTNDTYSNGSRKILMDSTFNHETYHGGCFLDRAFSSEAQKKIAVTEISVDNTILNDKLFLLDKTEAFSIEYGLNTESRKKYPTDFAKATNIYIDMATTWWWLRFTGSTTDQVGGDGEIRHYLTDSIDGGIAPAMCLPASALQ